ncbi:MULTISPECIES: type II CAAX endopeptidase family protein [Bacillus cereus group]|uniref:type II CAAX endopeptidase family protein n=1 Tax=Bacillus cereus group TaxID=86661 RepID=UPI001F3D8DD9|nr:type II CAAX endopeptidase family protein [Bacillus cereus]MDA1517383.1 type II CAAX endopeptidase family protein [Bacillus cereus]BCC04755.1 hypothetical protein BCM0060_1018 [Bacillus cereus]
MGSYFPKMGKLIGGLCVFLILLSSLWLIWIGETNIRYSGDHKGTMPFWNKWIPVMVGILLVYFLPFHHKNYNPLQQFEPRHTMIQAIVLFLSGSVFTISLLTTKFEGMALQFWFIIFKIILLLFIPFMLLLFYKSNPQKERLKSVKSIENHKWYRFTPLIVIIIWVYFNFFSTFSTPFVSARMEPTVLILILLVGFLINSVLEEFFYRVWLQTRLELLLSTWPAILLTSLLWASWHIALHGSGHWDIDIATVIVNHGIVGLFLGYVWARYRKVWAIIIVHGLMNAHPQQLIEIIFK